MRRIGLTRSVAAIAAASSTAAVVSAQPDGYEGWQIVAVSVTSRAELDALLRLQDGSREFQIWSDRPGLGELRVRVAPGLTTTLDQAGLRHRVVVADLQVYFDELARSRGLGDPCGYQPYDAVVAQLQDWASSSAIADIVSIGASVQGRPLWALRITGPGARKRGVLYHGAQHGDEYVGTSTIMRLAEHLLVNYGVLPEVTALVDHTEFYLLPVMNPDGYPGERYNAHGIDLNRNWGGPTGNTGDQGGPWPFSEPETAAIRDFLSGHPNVKVHVDLHGIGRDILWPWGYTAGYCIDHATFGLLGTAMQERIYAASGETFWMGPIHTSLYPVTGGSLDYSYSAGRLWAFAFELTDCEEALPALLYLAGWISDCNGNGVSDATELTSEGGADCNDNGVPDECEYQGDCDTDGALDICALARDGGLDCNANARPDSCDVDAGTSADCNLNLTPDECEPDCNENGVADACDIANGLSGDCDENGVPDECQADCDHNGTADNCELLAGASDCDRNGIPDDCQPDCDGNGVADVCDLIYGTAEDENGNGAPDACEDIWFVDDDAVVGGNGRAWSTAFIDLQNALAMADRGDVIRVAAGTYRPDRGTGDRDSTFHLISGVQLLGGYAGLGAPAPDLRDWASFETRLSGDLKDDDPGTSGYSDCCVTHDAPACSDRQCNNAICSTFPACCTTGWDRVCVEWAHRFTICQHLCLTTSENAFHVVTASGVDAAAVIDGFTISDGNANQPSGEHSVGAGIYNDGGDPAIRNCTLTNNEVSSRGGGIWNARSEATIENCSFVQNNAVGTRFGVAAYNSASELTFTHCQFLDHEGTAVVNHGSIVIMEKCLFQFNAGSRAGGALRNANSTVQIRNCQFLNNMAQYHVSRGGAMVNLWGGSVSVTDSVFSGNSADDDAGAVYNGYLSDVTLVGCTFTGNIARRAGGAIFNCDTIPVISNCIFWQNEDEQGRTEAAQIRFEDSDGIYSPDVSYSAVHAWSGALGGLGNFEGDPLFVDPLGADGVPATGDEDLRLSPDSPCVNSGDPEFEPPFGSQGLDGHARVLCGRVDIGAYEAGIGDYDCNGSVNLLDFGGWSTCFTGPHSLGYDITCEALDFENDGDVDMVDFAAFQALFGH